MSEWRETLERYASLTDRELEKYLKSAPESLRETMAYSLFAGGKRLRPVLVLASCELCGGTLEAALPFACAIEMIHTYSLIHDDLPAMDNDDYRRGKLTSHKMFGEDLAILTGDALLSLAFEVMLGTPAGAENFSAAREIATACGVGGMIAGQWEDVRLNGQVFDEKTMRYIHDGKTAAMIVGALRAGARCAGASEEQVNALTAYGREIGLVFQIVDDVLDVTGDEKKLGKPVGSDASKGKTTFVSLYGIDGAKEEAEKLTDSACGRLRAFGDRGSFLCELARYLLSRDH